MGRGTQLTEVEKGKISILKSEGYSIRKIAEKIGRSRCVVGSFYNNEEDYGKKKSPGRPRKLGAREDRRIQRLASNSQKTAKDIKTEMGLEVTPRTVLNSINRAPHLKRQKIKPAPNLKPEHVAARARIAKEWMSFGSKWDRVVFTDEKNLTWMVPTAFRTIGETYGRSQRRFRQGISAEDL